ncbi:MAG: hypothetical protein RL662_1163 [Bacteroidota bacterium]|jgi:biopolymer transport protein ExbD
MEAIDNGTPRRRKGQPSKVNLRVDFTPMVDMNMLLITFFMFCTTLASPQVMDIVMPAKVDPEQDIDPPVTPASRTLTLFLDGNNTVYYYMGMPDDKKAADLHMANLGDSSLRDVLLQNNRGIAQDIKLLKQQKQRKEISDAGFKTRLADLKKSKEGLTVLIKPTQKSIYRDLVNTLDEMQICNIGRYTVLEMSDADRKILNSFDKNTHVAHAQ